METVKIIKLVHGGQGLAELADGRKCFVWGGLPGETVEVRIIKKRSQYVEAIAEAVLQPAPERVQPKEDYYLATSPWQILSYEAENDWKHLIAEELFKQAHVGIGKFELKATGRQYGYRNKMEYGFWADEQGLSLAHYGRGSHRKIPVQGSILALPAVNETAQAVRAALEALGVEGRQLKTIIVRASQKGSSSAALFVKDKNFPKISLPAGVDGLVVYYSDPRSPASVATHELQKLGGDELTDKLLGKNFVYNVNSFFQVNIPIFEQALQSIKDRIFDESTIIDMYSGVGSIGLSVAPKNLVMVDIDASNQAMAERNAAMSGVNAQIILASTEKALEHIDGSAPVIFDPPRAGLHSKVVDRVLDTMPPQIIYLSCNPATQARDLALLQEKYRLDYFEAYNFFPRTPHIETLAILSR